MSVTKGGSNILQSYKKKKRTQVNFYKTQKGQIKNNNFSRKQQQV